MAVDVRQMFEQARQVMSRQVYSEPYERDGVTVILASRQQGGGGGGAGEGQSTDPSSGARGAGTGSGWGGGFGMNARPVGAFVISRGDVRFVPALDVNRVVVGGQLVALAMLLTVRAIVRARARRHR